MIRWPECMRFKIYATFWLNFFSKFPQLQCQWITFSNFRSLLLQGYLVFLMLLLNNSVHNWHSLMRWRSDSSFTRLEQFTRLINTAQQPDPFFSVSNPLHEKLKRYKYYWVHFLHFISFLCDSFYLNFNFAQLIVHYLLAWIFCLFACLFILSSLLCCILHPGKVLFIRLDFVCR